MAARRIRPPNWAGTARPGGATMIDARRGIITLADLRDHLQYAIGLELTTIPAYQIGRAHV